MTNMTDTTTHDSNPDPITGAPGSHPVGVGVGGTGGAVIGAAIGSLLGPIGTLIGGAAGTLVGAAAGKGVAERIDPTGEAQYWESAHATRPYYDSNFTYDDYNPAYAYGDDVRARHVGRKWDDSLESEVRDGWDAAKAKSRLTWEQAKDAVRDAFDRSDRTYRTYEARVNHAGRQWDDSLETDLERGWDKAKGTSRMAWAEAKGAVRDAWHGVERVMPGDADRDGR